MNWRVQPYYQWYDEAIAALAPPPPAPEPEPEWSEQDVQRHVRGLERRLDRLGMRTRYRPSPEGSSHVR
jgi:hypothetical protein